MVKDTSILHDLTHLRGKDALMLAHALKDLSAGEPLNDRDLLLEHGVSMLQSLPSNSGLSHAISNGFIGVRCLRCLLCLRCLREEHTWQIAHQTE